MNHLGAHIKSGRKEKGEEGKKKKNLVKNADIQIDVFTIFFLLHAKEADVRKTTAQ